MKQPPYKTIVCFGDSITCNWNTPSYVDEWQKLINKKHGSNKVTIIAKGINGETAQDGYYRVHRDVVAQHPDLVTIMFGHNDADPIRNTSSQQFALYLRKSINYIQHVCDKTDIWLLTPNQIGNATFQERYKPYLKMISLASKEKKCHFVDLWHIFQNEDLDTIFTYTFSAGYLNQQGKDWVHPNQKGNRIIAEKLFEELEQTK